MHMEDSFAGLEHRAFGEEDDVEGAFSSRSYGGKTKTFGKINSLSFVG